LKVYNVNQSKST